jgi:DNA-binding HxlR family transcriptional regulator
LNAWFWPWLIARGNETCKSDPEPESCAMSAARMRGLASMMEANRLALLMQRKSFSEMTCPIARTLELVGEWWSILILRDAFAGITRFDDFQESLGIGTNTLTRRLNALVDAGMLERRSYSFHPPRNDYVLTQRGRDFRPVLLALLAFGNSHLTPEGETVVIVDAVTGERANPIMVDRRSGRPLEEPTFRLAAGPAARGPTRERLESGRHGLLRHGETPEDGPAA